MLLLSALSFVLLLSCAGTGSSGSGTGGHPGSGGAASGGNSSTGGNSATGGRSATGGSSGSGGLTGQDGGHQQTGGSAGDCSGVTDCGGNAVGVWTVTSSCLTVGGTFNPSFVGLGCTSAPITGSLQVSGSFSAMSGGTFSDDTQTSGTETFTLAKACLVYSSTPITCDQAASVLQSLGFSELTCTTSADGGCACSGTVMQTGGMGLLSPEAATSGNYTAANGVLSIVGGPSTTTYSYCAAGSRLTVTPQATDPATTGTIVLQRAAAGMGGSAGSGGASDSGGASAGGSPGMGGISGAGGRGGRGTGGAGGAQAGAAGATGMLTGPCDVFSSAGTPCVAAHSTVRAMFAGYARPLYQVKKVSGGATMDIPLLEGTGIADAAAQDAFCGTTAHACTISVIYDQTGNGNDLKVAHVCPTCSGGQPDVEAFADGIKISVGGHPAYGVHIVPCGPNFMNPNQTGYRCDTPAKTATDDQPESVYMVVDGVNAGSGCCFDYGNASTTDTASGNMDAVEFSKNKYWGYGAGSGPWVAADLEAGIYSWNGASGSWQNPNSPSFPYPFVVALLKSNQNGKTGGPFALKASDARSGVLTTTWNGARPNGYSTLKKGGGIVLGIGGDNAAGAGGNFFEGAMTASFNSDATDDALQANVVAAGYGK